MAHFDRMREKYGDFVLIRGGLIAPDILMMSNPDVSNYYLIALEFGAYVLVRTNF